jgi:hypothetical protein
MQRRQSAVIQATAEDKDEATGEADNHWVMED